jgi:hypothetical protein
MSAARILSLAFLATTFSTGSSIGTAIAAGSGPAIEFSRAQTLRQKSVRPIHLSLVPTMPSVLAIGQPIGFQLRSTADGFGHLYVLSASGKVQLWFENLPVRKMHSVSYPCSGLQVRAAPPAGDETVIFVVTRERFEGFAGRGTTCSPLALQHTHTDFCEALRRKTARIERTRWAAVSSVIRVAERSP